MVQVADSAFAFPILQVSAVMLSQTQLVIFSFFSLLLLLLFFFLFLLVEDMVMVLVMVVKSALPLAKPKHQFFIRVVHSAVDQCTHINVQELLKLLCHICQS